MKLRIDPWTVITAIILAALATGIISSNDGALEDCKKLGYSEQTCTEILEAK